MKRMKREGQYRQIHFVGAVVKPKSSISYSDELMKPCFTS